MQFTRGVGQKIYNSGTPEFKALVEQLERKNNADGFDFATTSLTQVLAGVAEQQFYTIKISDYFPVIVGQGAWSDQLIKTRSNFPQGQFASGNQNLGSNSSRLATVDAGLDIVNIPVQSWAKNFNYTMFEVNQAARTGVFDVIEAKAKSMHLDWALGIQALSFLGTGAPNFPGLLNLPGIQFNGLSANFAGVSIAANFASSPATGGTLVAALMADYRTNSSGALMPDTFIMPESDYTQCLNAPNPTYPLESILEYMLDLFKTFTNNPNFKILPCRYADKANDGGSLPTLGFQMYVMLCNHPDNLQFNIPVDLTAALPVPTNGVLTEQAYFGQYCPLVPIRPGSIMTWGY